MKSEMAAIKYIRIRTMPPKTESRLCMNRRRIRVHCESWPTSSCFRASLVASSATTSADAIASPPARRVAARLVGYLGPTWPSFEADPWVNPGQQKVGQEVTDDEEHGEEGQEGDGQVHVLIEQGGDVE